MGLGGYLMWTAVAREVYNASGVRCLPIEQYENGMMKIIMSPIFKNNKHIIQEFNETENAFPLVLNSPHTNYCKQDTKERAIHRYDKHVIGQICEVYGITPNSLKCEMFFTNDEYHKVESLLASKKLNNEKFIIIEPHTKDGYTLNKTYPFKKWQSIADDISQNINVIQVGQKTEHVLNNCIDMTGKTSFREAALLISKSVLYVGSEGGLMHAANAVSTKSVIIITGFLHPDMTCYPDNVNIWVGKGHGPCGMKVICEKCRSECEEHDYNEVSSSVIECLGIKR